MTYCFNPDDVIELNRSEVPDNHILLDRKKLEGALARPLATFGGQYLHETVVERSAALLDGLVQAHAFIDGNKRIGWLCSVTYLAVNGVYLQDMAAKETEKFVLGVVTHEYRVSEAALWIAERVI